MKVGIPKEIKNNENRVGMTPAGVAELARRGHEVSVQHQAGEGSGFSDDDYVAAGARILPSIEAVYSTYSRFKIFYFKTFAYLDYLLYLCSRHTIRL